MSIHTSLKISGKLTGERNVWSRAERIASLKKAGKWKDGDDVVGLPKVRTRFRAKTKKVKAEAGATTEAAAGTAAAAAPAAAPAAEKKTEKKADKKAGKG